MSIPSNLLSINKSDISSSFQSLNGDIPAIDVPEIPQLSTLNTIIPDRLFTTGSLDEIRMKTLNVASVYINGLPRLPDIPVVPTIIIPRPRVPSYGQIKNYIKTKIDRIKQQRQQASIKSIKDELKKQENPFTYRQSLKNQQAQSKVLGRYNNQQG